MQIYEDQLLLAIETNFASLLEEPTSRCPACSCARRGVPEVSREVSLDDIHQLCRTMRKRDVAESCRDSGRNPVRTSGFFLCAERISNPLRHLEKDMGVGTMRRLKKVQHQACRKNERLRDSAPMHLLGYMRVSKADGSQVLDLQRDVLLAAGVCERQLYSDTASGKQ